MNWVEIIVHTTSSGADSVSSLMMDCGAAGTQTEDRADIPDPSQPHGIWEIIDPQLLEICRKMSSFMDGLILLTT